MQLTLIRHEDELSAYWLISGTQLEPVPLLEAEQAVLAGVAQLIEVEVYEIAQEVSLQIQID